MQKGTFQTPASMVFFLKIFTTLKSWEVTGTNIMKVLGPQQKFPVSIWLHISWGNLSMVHFYTLVHVILKRIFGPKREQVTGEWRKLHNEELNVLYSSPNIVWVIKLRRIRWAGHAACMGEGEAWTRFWWGNPGERGHWGDPGADGG